jgi:hypothetical protein
MNAISQWLVERATRLLDADEREVVRGDLAETGEAGARALVDVLSLVLRRQAAEWKTWRPWFALLLVAAPLGMLLSLISRLWADGTSVVIWLWWRQLHAGEELTYVSRTVRYVLIDYFALACWSWTCGFAIRSLSHRAAWLNGVLFFAMVLAGTIGSSETMRNDGRVFAMPFYDVVMPILVRVFFVGFPAVYGWLRGNDRMRLRPAIIWSLAFTTITLWEVRNIQGSASFFGWRPFGPLPHPGFDGRIGTDDDIIDWKLRLLPFVVMWPAVYILATTVRERLRSFDDQRGTR